MNKYAVSKSLWLFKQIVIMNKDLFTKERNDILTQIRDLRLKETELLENYIRENKQYEIGERVKVTNSRGIVSFGYVTNIKVDSRNEIDYSLVKEKKDGTPSKNTLYNFSSKISKEND